MTYNLDIIQSINQAIEIFSQYNLAKEAYAFYKAINGYVEENNLKQADPVLYGKYYKALLKLKFIALNMFDDWPETENLLKNHLEIIFEMKFYDLYNKIEVKLIYEPSLKRRDEIKDNLKKALLNSQSKLIDKGKIDLPNFPVTVSAWLKDFISKVGLKQIDKFKKVQYLTDSENIKKLNDKDKEKIRILVDLYENLSLSSNSAAGFEEDVPIKYNGKLGIFSKGEFHEIDQKSIDKMKEISLKIKGSVNENKNIAELKQLAAGYPPGSLERKAVEEEIRKQELGIRNNGKNDYGK